MSGLCGAARVELDADARGAWEAHSARAARVVRIGMFALACLRLGGGPEAERRAQQSTSNRALDLNRTRSQSDRVGGGGGCCCCCSCCGRGAQKKRLQFGERELEEGLEKRRRTPSSLGEHSAHGRDERTALGTWILCTGRDEAREHKLEKFGECLQVLNILHDARGRCCETRRRLAGLQLN